MNIRDLEYVVAVAEHRHFGRAAEACHISQPALSGQIRKLEDDLGVALFERTNRSVRITPVGEAIIPHARDLLALVTVIEETARAQIDPLSGPFRLGMIATIGPYLTPILLPSIRRGMPKIALSLSEDLTAALEAQLLDGRIDAAVIASPVDDHRLAEIPLYDEPFWIALPQAHPLAAADEIDVVDIRSEDLLLLADGHCLRDQVLSFFKRALRADPTVSTQHTSLATLLALVGTGAGVTLIPAMSLLGSWMTDSGIAVRREESGAASRAVRLAFRKSFPRRPLIEKLADIICAILPDTVSPERR